VRAPERDRGDRVDGGDGGGEGDRARFRVSGQADGTAGDGLDRARDRGHRRDRGTTTAHGTVERWPQTEGGGDGDHARDRGLVRWAGPCTGPCPWTVLWDGDRAGDRGFGWDRARDRGHGRDRGGAAADPANNNQPSYHCSHNKINHC